MDDKALSKKWHCLLNEALDKKLVIKTKSKQYVVAKEFKKLLRILASDEGLSDAKVELVTLAFQHGIRIDTKDPQIKKAVNRVISTPRLEKYARKLLHNLNTDPNSWTDE